MHKSVFKNISIIMRFKTMLLWVFIYSPSIWVTWYRVSLHSHSCFRTHFVDQSLELTEIHMFLALSAGIKSEASKSDTLLFLSLENYSFIYLLIDWLIDLIWFLNVVECIFLLNRKYIVRKIETSLDSIWRLSTVRLEFK